MDDKNVKNEYGMFGERPTVEKKFYDGKYIFAGLIIFLAVVIFPFANIIGKAVPVPQASLDTPVIRQLAAKDRTCVLSKADMRATHMQLLDDWRTQVVRQAQRNYTAPSGKKYLASLSNTCMECHSNKTQFCDQCHNYVAVTPTCWGCHLDKEQKVAKGEAKK
jgi:hypothetical protein